jgi:hypothetical protein
MGVQTSRKRNNGFGICKRIWNLSIPGIKLKRKIFWSNRTAKLKLTHITIIKTVMLMRNFGTGIVRVMTFFLRKFFL